MFPVYTHGSVVLIWKDAQNTSVRVLRLSRGRRTRRTADGIGVCHRRINWIMTVDSPRRDGRKDGIRFPHRAMMMLDVLHHSKQLCVM